MTLAFKPHGGDIDDDAHERQHNQPGSDPGAQIEKQSDGTHEDKNHVHSEQMDMRPFQGPRKLFCFEERF